MKLDSAIEDVQGAETALANALRRVGERHAVEADVYHVCRALAERCESFVERLLPFCERYGAKAVGEVDEPPAVVERLRRMSSELLGGHDVSGMLLLRDLRDLYVAAHAAELAWVELVQAAKAVRDAELLTAAQDGREEAERRWKWVRTRIKETSPQVLVAG